MIPVDALGDRVSFELASGRTVRPPASHCLLFDEDSRQWPRCSVLVSGFRRTGQRLEMNARQRAYYGAGYDLRAGIIPELPPVSIAAWREIGAVKRVYYNRPGTAHPDYYQHPFNEPSFWDFFAKKVDVVLLRRGSFLRLELGRGCIVNWRGFVKP